MKDSLPSGKQSLRVLKVNNPAHTAAVNRALRKAKNETDYKGYFLLFSVILITLVGNPGGWETHSKVSIFHVFYYGWITAISTGIGALPFFFIHEPDKFWMGVSNAIAVISKTKYLTNYIPFAHLDCPSSCCRGE